MEVIESESELSEFSSEKIPCPQKMRSKRIKKQKNFIQMVFFQNLQQRLKETDDSKERQEMITETARLMGMQKRQVYKWLWDEDL